MKLLLDTHFLLWLCMADEGVRSRPISAEATGFIEDRATELYFSAVSVWEVAIKHSLGRTNFQADPYVFGAPCSTGATGRFPFPANTERGSANFQNTTKTHLTACS